LIKFVNSDKTYSYVNILKSIDNNTLEVEEGKEMKNSLFMYNKDSS